VLTAFQASEKLMDDEKVEEEVVNARRPQEIVGSPSVAPAPGEDPPHQAPARQEVDLVGLVFCDGA
jgi:hypothetical protein